MAYEPLENEMVINCLYVEGGVVDKRPMSIINPDFTHEPILVGVHDNNLWFEKQGVFGFSIDKEIATALLKKIGAEDKFTINIGKIVGENLAKVLEDVVNNTKIE